MGTTLEYTETLRIQEILSYLKQHGALNRAVYVPMTSIVSNTEGSYPIVRRTLQKMADMKLISMELHKPKASNQKYYLYRILNTSIEVPNKLSLNLEYDGIEQLESGLIDINNLPLGYSIKKHNVYNARTYIINPVGECVGASCCACGQVHTIDRFKKTNHNKYKVVSYCEECFTLKSNERKAQQEQLKEEQEQQVLKNRVEAVEESIIIFDDEIEKISNKVEKVENEISLLNKFMNKVKAVFNFAAKK